MRNILLLSLIFLSNAYSQKIYNPYWSYIEEHNSSISNFWAQELGNQYVETCPVSYEEISEKLRHKYGFKDAIFIEFDLKRGHAGYLTDLALIYYNESYYGADTLTPQNLVHMELALAHEWGHHIENTLHGKGLINAGAYDCDSQILSEMKADCYAGLYARTKYPYIDEINIMKKFLQSAGSEDHGTGKQRVKAFEIGLHSFSYKGCDELKLSDL